MTLVGFLEARIAEDKAIARAVPSEDGPRWVDGGGLVGVEGSERRVAVDMYSPDGQCMTGEASAHIARWDPARVLAECEAKRRIVEMVGGKPYIDQWDAGYAYALEEVCKLLALLYADHPDHDGSWRP